MIHKIHSCTFTTQQQLFLTTCWSTSQLLHTCLKKLKQIQGWESTSRLSAYSDCSRIASLLQNSTFRLWWHPWHPDSTSWPHILPQVNQFSSVCLFQRRSKVTKVSRNFLLTQIVPKSVFQIPCSFCNVIHGIRTLSLDHIFNHKFINSCPFLAGIKVDSRSQKYLETFCLFRLFPSLWVASKFHAPLVAMTSVASGNYFFTTYLTTSQSIFVCLLNLEQIQGCKSTSKLSAFSDCSRVHCFEIPSSSVHGRCEIGKLPKHL
jgi:hypothetical protein